jgi:hypothetical protein
MAIVPITVSQPHFGQVWGWSPTLGKVGDLESSRTPECSELDNKGKNTSHWGVLGVVGKVLKRRYRKCPRIGNLDICSPSYGQKKGRESNWQFDSRPLKVGNRCLPDIRSERATWRWKDLDEGYNFGWDLVAIQVRSRELWRFKVPGVPPGQFRHKFPGLPKWSPEIVQESLLKKKSKRVFSKTSPRESSQKQVQESFLKNKFKRVFSKTLSPCFVKRGLKLS